MNKGGRTKSKATASAAGPGGLVRSRWLLAFLATAVTFAVLVSMLWERPGAVTVPASPAGYLDDRAGLLSPQFVAAKNQYLEYLSRTMRIAQISVVILPRAPSADVEEFGIRAATAWKIGAGGVDNGLALFVFRDDHKLRLEVGYGMESAITDAEASRLLAEVVVPAFARGQYEAGIEDFLEALNRKLEASEAADRRASPYVGLVASVMTVLRNAPNFGRKVLLAFAQQDTQGRFVIALFGSLFAGLAIYAVAGILAAIPAIVMLPWRLFGSPTLRGANLAEIGKQFSPRNFFARPPPFVISVFNELQLGSVVNAAYMLASIVAAILLLSAGSGLFMDGLGKFGGAGATLSWPAR